MASAYTRAELHTVLSDLLAGTSGLQVLPTASVWELPPLVYQAAAIAWSTNRVISRRDDAVLRSAIYDLTNFGRLCFIERAA